MNPLKRQMKNCNFTESFFVGLDRGAPAHTILD